MSKRPIDKLDVLWSEPGLLAISKPSGLAVIPGRGQDNCVLIALARQLNLAFERSQSERIRIIHRIDRYTSGVLLVATNKDAQRHVSTQFRNRQVHKEYLALVTGSPKDESGIIDAPLALHATQRSRMILSKHGTPALTHWEVAERFRGYTLLRCFPKTGKTHQIRIHLASMGLPLAIDPIYNRRPPSTPVGVFLSQFKRGYRASGEERPLISRLTLHAHRLSFASPSGQATTVEDLPPRDFRATLQMLGKYGR